MGARDGVPLDPAEAYRASGVLAGALEEMAARPEQLISSELRRAVRDDVLHVVTAMLPRSEADERAPLLGTRCRIADRARTYVHDRVDQALTIADVCKAIGVCRRSLQYSFNDVYGITPVKYLKIVRLNGARRDLRDAESGLEAVQDVAAKWGFWHLSHFAEDYRRLFLETPSQTLRSRPVALA